MSLTMLLLFTLSNIALAESGVDDCEEGLTQITSEQAVYVEGVGCVIDDISEVCDERESGECRTWDQILLAFEAYPSQYQERFLLDCAAGSVYAHRLDTSSNEWESYEYYDEDGFIAGFTTTSSSPPFCCNGVQTYTVYYGDPLATCIEPEVTADTSDTAAPTDTGDTPKPGPCGCAANKGAAAAALLAACSLLTARRRRQP